MVTSQGRSFQGRAGRPVLAASLAVLALSSLALAGCNGGPASAPARDHAQDGGHTTAMAGSSSASGGYSSASGAYGGSGGAETASYGSDRPDPRREPIPLVHGKPMWAANRLHTAQENAEYHFEHDGSDFGANSVDDFVTKVHAFVDKPSQSVETLTRTNGDRLLYDAQNNVFAVVTKDGAPRTMFKPRAGAAYWDQQKAQIAEEANGGDSSGGGPRRYYSRKPSGGGSDDQG